MTHEEKAREIIRSYEGDEDYIFLLERITSALASAEKKGREDKIPSSTCYLRGWNEAISAAVKVAEKKEKEYSDGCNVDEALGCHEVAKSLNKLKKG